MNLTESGELRLDGDHAGTLVRVLFRLDAAGTLRLSWIAGVTHPFELERRSGVPIC